MARARHQVPSQEEKVKEREGHMWREKERGRGKRERKKKEKEGREGGEAKEMEKTCFGSQTVTDTGLAQTVVTSLKNHIPPLHIK